MNQVGQTMGTEKARVFQYCQVLPQKCKVYNGISCKLS